MEQQMDEHKFQDLVQTLSLEQAELFYKAIDACCMTYLHDKPSTCLFILGIMQGALYTKMKELKVLNEQDK